MPKPFADLIVGVDLDGVCADFYARMRQIAAEWLERPVDELTPDVSYGLSEWGVRDMDQYSSLHRFAVTQRGLFQTVGMIPGARKYLRLMSDEGARIRIITHRLFIPYFHRIAVSQTIDWLDGHAIPYWDLCFMREKEQVGAHVYVDDSPSNIRRLRDGGAYAICYENSTNRDVPAPRAANWEDVYGEIHAWFQRRPGSAP